MYKCYLVFALVFISRYNICWCKIIISCDYDTLQNNFYWLFCIAKNTLFFRHACFHTLIHWQHAYTHKLSTQNCMKHAKEHTLEKLWFHAQMEGSYLISALMPFDSSIEVYICILMDLWSRRIYTPEPIMTPNTQKERLIWSYW